MPIVLCGAESLVPRIVPGVLVHMLVPTPAEQLVHRRIPAPCAARCSMRNTLPAKGVVRGRERLKARMAHGGRDVAPARAVGVVHTHELIVLPQQLA